MILLDRAEKIKCYGLKCTYFLGFFALMLMSFFSMITDKFGSRAGKVVMVLGVLLLLRQWRYFLKSPIFYFILAVIGIQLLSWGLSHLDHPQWAEDSPKVGRMLAWFMFVPVAFFLQGDTKKILFIGILAMASVFISPWVTGDGMQEIMRGINGRRVDFGVHNAQHIAMLFGVSLILGFYCLFIGHQRKNHKLIWFVLGTLVVVISALGVVVTQTRAVWLGLVAVLLSITLGYLIVSLRSRKLNRAGLVGLLAIFTILIGLFSSNFGDTLSNRVKSEFSNVKTVLSGSSDYKANSSTGIRLTTWTESLEWIAERPFAGWGGNGRELVVKHSDRLTERNKERFRHLHNSYLDTLVNYGVLGLMCLFGLFVYWGYLVKRTYTRQALSAPTLVMLSMLLIFWLVINCFESYMYYSSGSYILALIGGTILSVYWKTTGFFEETDRV
ncbi:O-antigen ligase family protein [Litoribrevibacter euphylliae]|uniref:O-antigen ligase family protein n=1 Tax=Litoribrevibacter euphylliae TaxID=1834034 RepID=A0ABV7HP93_9GAMM